MARAVAVLQNLIWEFKLDGPQETVQQAGHEHFPYSPKMDLNTMGMQLALARSNQINI